MSYPANPLDQYQSYSYHHFLVAASTTEVLRQINTGAIPFTMLSSLKHGDPITTSADGTAQAVMVLNSAVESKFYIDFLTYSAVYVDVSKHDAKLTQLTELEMVVQESGGATFLNFLRTISDEILETSFGSVCFLLKTFFVGHEISGGTTLFETNAVSLLLTNMDSSFNEEGGSHTLKFCGMSNGAPLKNDNLHYVNRNLNLVTNKNSILLKDLVADLEKKLNAQLEDQWKAVQAETGGYGRKVKYKFTLPKSWDSYTVKSLSKDNFVERLFEKEKQAVQKNAEATKNSGTQNKPGVESDHFKTSMNTAVKTTVTQILSEIFKHCEQIHAAFVANSKLTDNNRQLAKLHQVLSSITSDDHVVTVHFDVINYYLPKLDEDAEKIVDIKSEITDKDKAAETFDKYGITFEYIFTGANSDIIQLDMKANHTNVLLINNQTGVQKATGNMTATDKTVVPAAANKKQVNTGAKEVNSVLAIRKNDAVYLSDLPADAQHGYIYAAPDAASMRTAYINKLALLAATSTQNMHVVIRGNPHFLNHIVRPIFPHDDMAYEKAIHLVDALAIARATGVNDDYDQSKEVHMFGTVSNNLPQFVKILIKTPIYDQAGAVIGYEPFWYRGRYRIHKILNHFKNGSFQQELFLLPYDLRELA